MLFHLTDLFVESLLEETTKFQNKNGISSLFLFRTVLEYIHSLYINMRHLHFMVSISVFPLTICLLLFILTKRYSRKKCRLINV